MINTVYFHFHCKQVTSPPFVPDHNAYCRGREKLNLRLTCNKHQAAFLYRTSLPRNTCLKKRANTHINLTKQNTEKHVSFTNKQQAPLLFQTTNSSTMHIAEREKTQ